MAPYALLYRGGGPVGISRSRVIQPRQCGVNIISPFENPRAEENK